MRRRHSLIVESDCDTLFRLSDDDDYSMQWVMLCSCYGAMHTQGADDEPPPERAVALQVRYTSCLYWLTNWLTSCHPLLLFIRRAAGVALNRFEEFWCSVILCSEFCGVVLFLTTIQNELHCIVVVLRWFWNNHTHHQLLDVTSVVHCFWLTAWLDGWRRSSDCSSFCHNDFLSFRLSEKRKKRKK